jgi:hypothetical protein
MLVAVLRQPLTVRLAVVAVLVASVQTVQATQHQQVTAVVVFRPQSLAPQ